MFTGIVQGLATVISIEHAHNSAKLTLKLPVEFCENLMKGASIAVEGTCLTITSFDNQHVSFDIIGQTLAVTHLSALESGMRVNFERAAKFNDEIGGHLLSGHIKSTVKIVAIDQLIDNTIVWFSLNSDIKKYVMDKGFIGLNGCSLTIAEVQSDKFCVHLIPETLEVTSFSKSLVNDLVNIEIDHQTQTIVDTVERVLKNRT